MTAAPRHLVPPARKTASKPAPNPDAKSGAKPGAKPAGAPRRIGLAGPFASPTPLPAPATPVDTPAPALPQPVAGRRTSRAGLISFVALVLLPLALSTWYLFARAGDQWASTLSFTVERLEPPGGGALPEGLTLPPAFSAPAPGETALLLDFLQAQALVERVNARLDLARRWTWPGDPLLAYDPEGTIEDLTRHWRRMVRVSDSSASGVIRLRVLAYSPADAQAIATAIQSESAQMVNLLSDRGRGAARHFAADELARAEARLSAARSRLAEFRARTGLIDPAAEMSTETGVLGLLQQQLAEALVEAAMLDTESATASARKSAVTAAQSRAANQRIAVLRARIAEERSAVGSGENRDYSRQLAEYERHMTELDFARATWTSARAGYEAARAEAGRTGFYLASYADPSRPERATQPRRWLILGLGGLALALIWAVLALATSALRDRV